MPDFGALDAAFTKDYPADEPGCAVAVLKRGRVLFWRGYGSARPGEHEPITPGTIFNLGSVSKQFTAFCVLLLQDRGRLSLDDGIRKYFREFPARFEPIKLHHLMHHSGGLPCMVSMLWNYAGAGKWGRGISRYPELIARQSEFNFRPGHAFCYNNDGYFLLGEIVRKVSGLSLARFAQNEIFGPLGMEKTRIREHDQDRIPNLAVGCTRAKKGWKPNPKKFFVPGPADVWSCLEDLRRWELNVHEPKIGSRAVHRAMLRPGRTRSQGAEAGGYGGGLCLGSYLGEKAVFHDGLDTGFWTEYWRFPRRELAVLMLHNRDNFDFSRTASLIAGALDKPLPRPKPLKKGRVLAKAWKGFEGHYLSRDGSDFWEIKRGKHGYQVLGNFLPFVLKPDAKGLCPKVFSGTTPVQCTLKRDGGVPVIRKRSGRSVAELVRMEKGRGGLAWLADCVGAYRNPASGLVFRIQRRGPRVFSREVSLPKQKAERVYPLGEGRLVFKGGAGWAEWERDARGRVIAFYGFSPSGRVRKLRYVKMAEGAGTGYRFPKALVNDEAPATYALPMRT